MSEHKGFKEEFTLASVIAIGEFIYRARIHYPDNTDPFRNIKELSYRTDYDNISLGRCNNYKQSTFYGSLEVPTKDGKGGFEFACTIIINELLKGHLNTGEAFDGYVTFSQWKVTADIFLKWIFSFSETIEDSRVLHLKEIYKNTSVR